VGENKPPALSEGWTIVLMDRASRFIWEISCGEKEATLFEKAIQTLVQVIEQTDDLSLVSDGELKMAISCLKFVMKWLEPVKWVVQKRL